MSNPYIWAIIALMTKATLQKEIQSLTDQIVKKYHPQKIILFGSAARGDFGRDSDLDFLVIKKAVPKSNIHRRWELRKLVDESLPVDFLVLKPDELKIRLEKEDPFVEMIMKEGKVLYG